MKKFCALLGMLYAVSLCGAGEMVDAFGKWKYLHRDISDKGLSAADIMAKAKSKCIPAARPAPVALLKDQFTRKKNGSIVFQRVPVELLEESGVSRVCQVQTLLPLKKGGIFSTSAIDVKDNGKSLPVQTVVTGHWEDGSLKFVLLNFDIALKAGEKKFVDVEFGSKVARKISGNIKIIRTADKISVNTGRLSADIDLKNFKLLENIRVDGKSCGSFGKGMVLADENGNLLPADSVKRVIIENSGKLNTVIRIDGFYGGNKDYSFTCRLIFKSNSPAVGIRWTHINTALKYEFTDVKALYCDFSTGGDAAAGARTFQYDENKAVMPGGKVKKARSEGSGSNGRVNFAFRDFWQRFPKAFVTSNNGVRIELLPFLSDDYGSDLPWYHRFAFRSGRHRSKWGMAFTEHFVMDFSGKCDVKALSAELNKPVLGVLPAEYYASTRAIPGVMGVNYAEFKKLDVMFEATWQDSLMRREKQREYGYFNYGDAYGERKVNWNNNEYDFGAALFLAFFRTGKRDYFRWAQTAAAHQADVDICHAYPDPYYTGCNLQHSIGHTGLWNASKKLDWSFIFDEHSHAGNGHVWTRAMCMAYTYGGDGRCYDAAQELGNHIAYAYAPNLKKMYVPRSVGWSLKAICHIYEMSGDEEHKKAADAIFKIIRKEQAKTPDGAWGRKMHRLVKYGEKRVVGSATFQGGLLLGALADYHRLFKNPEAEKSFLAGIRWIYKGWSPGNYSWYYDLDPDGRPLNSFLGQTRFCPDLNGLPMVPMMYAANLTGNKKYQQCAFDAFCGLLYFGLSANAKSFSFATYDLDRFFEYANEWSGKHPADKFVFDAQQVTEKMLKTERKKFMFRTPTVKEFKITLRKPAAEVKISHLKYLGNAGKKVDKYLKIYSSAGKLVCEDGVDSDKNYTGSYKLTGKPGDLFTVKISDDMSAVWDIACSEDYSVSVDVPEKGVGIGNAFVISAFYFVVPAGKENFTVWACGLTGNDLILELRDRNGRPVKTAELKGRRLEINHTNPDPSKPSVWQFILRNRGTSTVGLENTAGEIFTELPF